MSTKYYIRAFGKVEGPYSVGKLEQMRESGEFSDVYEVSMNQRDWLPADVVISQFSKRKPIRKKQPTEPTGIEVTIAEPPLEHTPRREQHRTHADEWYYSRNGVTSELPVDFAQIELMYSSGTLSANDYVLKDGTQNWIQVANHPRLAGQAYATDSPENAMTLGWGGTVSGIVSILLIIITMVLFVGRLRRGGFVPSENLVVIFLAITSLFFATISASLGHLNIRKHRSSVISKDVARLIVISLSCGYTTVITEVILAIILVVHLINS